MASSSVILSLPTESRLLIYAYLFDSPTVSVSSQRPTKEGGQTAVITTNFDACILQTCRLIHSEAKEVLASSLEILLIDSDLYESRTDPAWIECLPKPAAAVYLPMIQKITISGGALYYETLDLDSLPSLREVFIEIWGHIEAPNDFCAITSHAENDSFLTGAWDKAIIATFLRGFKLAKIPIWWESATVPRSKQPRVVVTLRDYLNNADLNTSNDCGWSIYTENALRITFEAITEIVTRRTVTGNHTRISWDTGNVTSEFSVDEQWVGADEWVGATKLLEARTWSEAQTEFEMFHKRKTTIS